MLTAYIDFKAPASYLAFEPTLRVLKDRGAAVQWKPFRCWDRPIPNEVQDPSVSARHRRVRAQSRLRIHQHYAELRGLEMHWRESPGSSDRALGVLALWSGDATRFIESCYRAYWVQGQDLNDTEVVNGLAVKAGWTGEAPNIDAALGALEREQEEGELRGIVDAPAYVVSEHMFVGREHLPWVRELL